MQNQIVFIYTQLYIICLIYYNVIQNSIIVILWKHSSKFYGSNGLCYPLYIEDPFVDGWQYSAFMFLGLHTIR